MNKLSNKLATIAIAFVMLGLVSCVGETCVVCTMEGSDSVEQCSDGSILQESALEEFQMLREADGYTCN